MTASDRELKMAQQLIDSLSSDFDPSKYRDTYRDAVLDLIERKAQGEEITIQPADRGADQGARPDGRARGLLAAVKEKAPAQGNGRRPPRSAPRRSPRPSARARRAAARG